MARGSKTDDIPEHPPSVEEDLYEILGVKSDATPEAVKSAYKKNALKNHPDKVSEEAREEANAKFQRIALAYAVLSDERRRKTYDRTGRTEESLDDEDFDWMDFYREQLSAMLDTRAISDFQKKYQSSDEEKQDLLEAYQKFEGSMDHIYESVMLSNVLDDDVRFRAIIDKAIAEGSAQKEAKQAEKHAKKIEADKKKKAAASSKTSKGPTVGEDDLLAMISKRQQDRGQGFMAHLEEKYGAKGKKRGAVDEPPEEAFAAVGARKKSKDTKTKSKKGSKV
ncbi:J domain-containing protein [Penicillium maclennaniae]|uniref:J domain-containing protein n=1 Tax=Penicillium maclennaniae TaxID=1343394 RepID=UPI0025403BFD|nr:J domain-containing protein [Penicillium maclennaniae]KAJ5662234.1 J domain-containing protein [Penicillium maclennaniae]